MFSRMLKLESFGASVTVSESPQPNRLISRLSRAARMLPVTGVRLTQARSRVLALPVAERRDPARRAIGRVGQDFRTDRAEPLRIDLSRVGPCAGDVPIAGGH